ncbi:MAG TPA: mandelate racemase/muconate lactonizing enzyme family protein [Microlunatus sp.]
MKIISISSYQQNDQLALVRVRTDDGAEGWGQTSAYLADQSVPAIHDQLSRYFLGRDPWDLPALVDECVRTDYKFYGTVMFRALCGIETAIWDLLGKVVERPVYQLLGGTVRSTIGVYGSSMRRDITPEAEAERLSGLVSSGRFTDFKIRVGAVMGRDADAAPGRTAKIIKTVREAVGDDVSLRADANGCYTPAAAIKVGRLLEAYDYYHFEEPCPYPQLENTAQVAAALDIAVAGGEQDQHLEQFHRMITDRVVDIVQPDIGYIGGILRARKVALMAEAAGIPCTPHCANTSLLQVFTLQLAACSPSVHQPQEWSIEEVDWTKDVFDGLPQVRGGTVELGAEPGWGVEINQDYLARCESRTSSVTAG